MIGFTGELVEKVDDTFLKTSVTITDADTIEKIEAGKTEVSAGYEAELEETPGVFDGEPYDCIQRNIIYNHVSLVDRVESWTRGPLATRRRWKRNSGGYNIGENHNQRRRV